MKYVEGEHGLPIYVPSRGAASWQELLADPVLHWRDGFSAKSLAESWENARGLPAEVYSLLAEIGSSPELLFAFPEHKVPLPGSSRGDSQNDVFALVRAGETMLSMTVEGKVNESFDLRLDQWLKNASAGKLQRLAYLAEMLGLDMQEIPATIHYQLLHRTASALIEAERFKTDIAAMIVHSFSPTVRWFESFVAFARLLGVEGEIVPGKLLLARTRTARPLHLGWASGRSNTPTG